MGSNHLQIIETPPEERHPPILIKRPVGNDVVPQRPSDGYFDATRLCKQAGKRFNNYYQNAQTKAFLNALSLDTGIPVSKLVRSTLGRGDVVKQGTWVHPYVAPHLGQWLSPEFAVQVNKWVAQWMSGSIPYTPAYARRFVLPEANPWYKVFPDGFFTGIYRSKGWPPYRGHHTTHEVVHIINDIVYSRLEPGLLPELRRRNPYHPKGRKRKHHRYLTLDEGHPKLARHLEDLMLLMSVQADGNWAGFKLTVDRAFPQYDTNLSLPLDPLAHWGKP